MKKSLIIIDPLSPRGHFDINKVVLDILSKEYSIRYYAADYFRDLVPENVEFHGYDKRFFELKKSPIINRLNYYKGLSSILNDLNMTEKEQLILFMSYDIIIIYLLQKRLKFKDNHIFLYNHSNVDDYDRSSIKSLLFKSVSKTSYSIVYEDFIKDYLLKKYGINTFVARHTLNNYKRQTDGKVDEANRSFIENADDTLIVSLSGNAIEESILEELIRLDKSGLLSNNRFKFYIKSKKYNYKSGNLWITGTYLSDTDYAYLIKQSKYMLLCYDSTRYRYRVSGVYFDALTFEKPILYSDSLFFSNQVERFGEIGIKMRKSMIETLEECQNCNYNQLLNNIISAKENYSDEKILNDFRGLFI